SARPGGTAARAGWRCAPPPGSATISPTTPKPASSAAVRRRSAALRATVSGVRSRKRIDAQPSGEITEYQACSCMSTRSARARASAPPLPPSPITALTTGTRSPASVRRLAAIASACPRSSAPMPGYAPCVSMRVITGRAKRSASSKRRTALRYPSGRGMPKLRSTRSAVERPRCCATTTTAWPRKRASPPTIAPSSGALGLRGRARGAHHGGEGRGEVRASLDAGEQLAVADRREAGRGGAEPPPAERTHLVEEAGLQHGARARRDAGVQLGRRAGETDQERIVGRLAEAVLGLPARERHAAHERHLERPHDAHPVAGRDARR